MKKVLVLLALFHAVSAAPVHAGEEPRRYWRIVEGRPEFLETARRPGRDWQELAPRVVALNDDTSVPVRLGTVFTADPPEPEPASGDGPIVAIIDTGIDVGHPWFRGRLLEGAVFHDEPGGIEDLNGHGTHVAGIVALTYPSARLLPIRALDRYGSGNDLHLAEAVTWAVDHGASVINMSLGAPWALGPWFEAALNYADERGVLVVAAAGNDGPNSPPHYPAAYPPVLAVTAVDANFVEASFTQRGEYIDVAAIGVNVSSALPGGRGRMSGTSMATPRASGLAALLRHQRPEWTAAQIHEHISATAEDVGRPGRDEVFGWGVMNPQRAIETLEPARNTTATSKYVITLVPGGVRLQPVTVEPHYLTVESRRPDGVIRKLKKRDNWRLLYDEPGEYRVHAYDQKGRLLGWETVTLGEPGYIKPVETKRSTRGGRWVALRAGTTKAKNIVVWAVEERRLSWPITEIRTGRGWVAAQIPRGVNWVACYSYRDGQVFGCSRALRRPVVTPATS